MRITVELRRPARRSVAILLGLLLLAAPAAVLAVHQFSDVPTSNPFHDEISAIAKAGITAGFDDGTYRPTEPVTRQAMAAFMQRGFGRVGLATRSSGPTVTVDAGSPGTGDVLWDAGELYIDVPGATNNVDPNQLVLVHGQVGLRTIMGDAQGCPCEVEVVLYEEDSGTVSARAYGTFYDPSSNEFAYSIDIQSVFVAAPGQHRYEVLVGVSSRADPTNAASFQGSWSSLTALTVPFGPTGSNTLQHPWQWPGNSGD